MRTATRALALALATGLTVAGAATAAPSDAPRAAHAPAVFAGPPGGVVPAHEDLAAARVSSVGSVKLLTYHQGPVMTSGATVRDIYWGTKWGDTTFTGDKQTGLATLYGGLGGSPYMATNTEYSQSGGLKVSSAVRYEGSLRNANATSKGAPSTSAVLSAVATALSTAGVTPPVDGSGYYPVYSDQPRGTAGYCAWHSYGTINGTPVQFAFFFNLDGDSGCNPNSSLAGSQGLKALANVSGHELSEAVTDPKLNAWYDSQGYENSDKCAWTFSATPVTIGGVQWKIQGNWSNAAYNANQGYTRGCISTA